MYPAVIMVVDEASAERALAAGTLICPHCERSLRPWSYARPRLVRLRDGGCRRVRPRRGRCRGCRRTQVLLAAWCVPGRADEAETVGVALLAACDGWGHRRIAVLLDRPEATVRGWLRAARAHTEWLRTIAVRTLHRVDADPAPLELAGSPLGDALSALGAAAAAIRRLRGPTFPASGWAVIVLVSRGRLLRPLPTVS